MRTTTRSLSCALIVSMSLTGMSYAVAQSQRARQGPQTPAPVPGPILQPAAGVPLKQLDSITAQNPRELAQFGDAVALSGDGTTLAVGASPEDAGEGAVYVFARRGDRWVQEARLKASNAGPNDRFGHSVALSADGRTLAVAAYFESSRATGVNGDEKDDSVPQAGAVYMFTRTATGW